MLELLTPSNNERKAENLENEEKDILKIKGSNTAYIRNDHLHYISPLKVSKLKQCMCECFTKIF